MKTIRIYMLHPAVKSLDEMLSYLQIESLRTDFNFKWCPENPDYLVVSEHFYTNRHYNIRYKQYIKERPITILYAAEAMSPDFNMFDYAVSFDGELTNGDRHAQLMSPFVLFNNFAPVSENEITTIEEAKEELIKKKGFCNFLYSNSNAHPNRDKLFHFISTYKRIDSLGRHLNNVQNNPTGFQGHREECVPMKSTYKFSIASENAIFKGYTSEKILTSLAAHTIPIYWGNPDIVKDINPESFINCFDYNTLEEVLEKIKEIDENDDLWCEMISQPWQTEEQIILDTKRNEQYIAFFKNIFAQNIVDARRMPEGTMPKGIQNFMYSAKPFKLSIWIRLKNRLMKMFCR